MKIYDCFTYCGEDLLLKIRLESLFNKVDKFIIIEGNKYFNGETKSKFFDINKFEKYQKKINYYFIEDYPKHVGNNWEYEFYQRNQIKRGLTGLLDEDLILISDVDEIPKLDNENSQNITVQFSCKICYYKFNIHYYGLKWNNKWPGTKSCKFKFIKSSQKIRDFIKKNIHKLRIDQRINRYIEWDGGWHFAYLMNENDISNKLKRFDHEINHLLKNKEFNKDKLTSLKDINTRIKLLKDPYEREDVKLKKVNIDHSFPKYILENMTDLNEFII